ncbi:MAG: cyclic nucleotide-binding domain-containing protein [Deltaproteobacteria bacterium]|nr:cyclic nucleotide-binding domain-containing protein [Deltaproteobacteria bacterium]
MPKFEVRFKAQTIIFEEKSVEDTMYFIREGKVEISKNMGDTKQVIALLGPNDFFGEMALVSKAPRFATATALTDTTAVVFNRNQFFSLLKTKGEIILKIMEVLILRLKDANDTVRKLIQKNQKALVFDALTKWLQVKETDADIQHAADWVATQLCMKTRETEAVIRKLVLMNLISLNNNRISLNKNETFDKLKSLVED